MLAACKLGGKGRAFAGGFDHLGAEERVFDGRGGLQGDGVEQFQIGRRVGCAGRIAGQGDDAGHALPGAQRRTHERAEVERADRSRSR